jgi:hypothetical protein
MEPLTDGKLLITGGGTQLNPQRTNSTEIYDLATGTSVMVDTTAIPQEQSPILMLYNGKVMMTHRPPQLYDPPTQQWDACADFLQGNRMPNGDHADHELVHLPDSIVVAIGYRSFTAGVPGNFIHFCYFFLLSVIVTLHCRHSMTANASGINEVFKRRD